MPASIRKGLAPIKHRGERAQADLALLRSREALVNARTQLINHDARGAVKSFGHRLPKCSTASFHKKVAQHIPEELAEALYPVVQSIASLSERIALYDKQIQRLATDNYPETELVRQVKGMGALSALAFVLTLEDPGRFEKAGWWEPTWGSPRARSNPGIVTPKSASPRRATKC